MDRLELCPYCGNEEVHCDVHSDRVPGMKVICRTYYAICANCGAQGPKSEAAANSIGLWNTVSKQIQSLVKEGKTNEQ